MSISPTPADRLQPIEKSGQQAGGDEECYDYHHYNKIHSVPFAVDSFVPKLPDGSGRNTNFYVFHTPQTAIHTVLLLGSCFDGSEEPHRRRQGDVMILSATLKKDSADQATVRYVDSYGGRDAFLAGAFVVRASDLPDPPPALLHVSVSWYQAPGRAGTPNAGAESALAANGSGHRKIEHGDRVKIIKSKVSGVENPPEWLEQHLGKTGLVLWMTAGGANVDLDGCAVWFAYDELERQD
jgi:hypothetical protein